MSVANFITELCCMTDDTWPVHKTIAYEIVTPSLRISPALRVCEMIDLPNNTNEFGHWILAEARMAGIRPPICDRLGSVQNNPRRRERSVAISRREHGSCGAIPQSDGITASLRSS